MTIIRFIHSLTGNPYNLFVPGYDPDNLVVIPSNNSLDLLSVISPETLHAAQENIQALVIAGVFAIDGTISDAQLWDLASSSFQNSSILYVDGINGSDQNNGGPTNPFKTIQRALNSVGSASSAADYDNPLTSRWSVMVAPGVYTENLFIGTRQIIDLDLNNALIIGNVTQTLNTADEPGTIRQNKLIIRGRDLRSVFASAARMPISGIQGNLTILQSGFPNEFFANVHLMQVGITGDFIADVSGASPYTVALFASDAFVLGTIRALDNVTITLIAENCDTEASNNIGAIFGQVNLYILRNVRFTNPVVASGTAGGRWYNVTFPVGANDFTGYAGTVYTDSNSYESFQTNVPTKGTFTFSLIDNAIGTAYSPATSSDWGTTIPTTVQQALDLLAAKNAPVS